MRHNKHGALYDLKKYIIWCVRNTNNYNVSGQRNANSAPCHICVQRLMKFGFHKMGYSDNNGNMIIIKLKDYTCKHLSSSQLKLAKQIKV